MYAADVFGILDKSTVLDDKNVWSPLHSFSPFSSVPSLGMLSPRLSLGSVYHLLPVSAFALTGYGCPDPQCRARGRTYRSAAADALALPSFTFGLDVVVLAGQLHFGKHQTLD